MASLVLAGDTSGSITVSAPAVSGSNTQTLVATTGTLAPIVSATAQASTSGTSIDFTSIPSWVKRITVILDGVSTNGTSPLLLRVGTSGGVVATGYNASAFYTSSAGSFNISSVGFPLTSTSLTTAAGLVYGTIIISSLSSTIWSQTGTLYLTTGGGASVWLGGNVTFSGTLDRVRVTTTNGSDTFDAGTINILYE